MYDTSVMPGKAQRQAVIKALVEAGRARTQADILEELASHAIRVDQSTLSRDLRELGVRKDNGEYVLKPASETNPEEVDLAPVVRRFVACGPNLIVITTDIGQAQPVALRIEREADSSIVATLAGDDTLFVATKNQRTQAVALRRLAQWFGDKHES